MAPPNKKPRGPSAYFIFTEEKRPEVMARLQAESENGKAAAPAIAKALGQLWASMSEEEKEAYRYKAKERAELAAADNNAAAADQDQEEAAADAPTQAVAAAIPKHIVKRIMLTDDEVQRVSADALWVVGEAARLFVQQLAAKGAAAASVKKRKTIKLEDFEHVVRRDKRLVAAGLKDVVNDKGLYELNGVAANAAVGRKTPGKAGAAAAPKAGGNDSQEPTNQRQEAERPGIAEAAVEGNEQQQPELTDEERIALEEAKRRKVAELMKARAAKAAERKKQKEAELAKSTHKITTFFVSSKPDDFV